MPAELEPQQVLGEDEFGAALAATLSRVVPRYLRGSHPIGLSLTGGLDTRGIVAFAPALSTYRAYTYGGMFRETFDVRVARQVAHACGCQHEVLSLGDEFLGRFPQLAEETVWITDGTLDVAGSHEIYLSRRAREIAPIRLTGNYGSEVLRGISTFKPLRLPPSLFDPGFQPLVNAGEHALAAAKNVHPVTFTVFEEIPRHLYGRLAAAQSELTVRTPYMDNEVVSLAYRAPRNLSLQRRLWQRMIARHNPALGAIPTDRGLGGREQSLAGRWRRLNRYLTFKAEWYYESGMPGWAAWLDARLGRGRRPPWPVGTHKIENYRRWFRDELHPWLSGELHDTSAMPFLSRPAVRETIAAHGAGAENFTAELSRLLTIALVTRTLLNANVFERIRGATSDTPAPVELDRGLTGASVLNLSQPL
jgi:asparagine synthase (glutamine-hydrolysing)